MENREDFNSRVRKLSELKRLKIDPYPHSFRFTHSILQIVNENNDCIKYDDEISTVGRIVSIRRHGKLTFTDLLDEGVKIQLCFRVDELGSKYNLFLKFIDRGDFVGVRGRLFKTRMGELTLLVTDFQLLAKSLYDLPHSWYGIRDVEVRYRQRYLDILMNPQIREVFIVRSRIIQEIRRFLDGMGFMEVETPIIQPLYGGADAKPFTTHVNALGDDWFLRISPELYLKRLLVAGFNRVYEIARVFRNEDIDSSHNPEFTMLEAYQAYADYNDMMELSENLLSAVSERVLGSLRLKFGEHEIDLTPPWRKLRMFDAIKKYADLDVKTLSDEEIREILEGHNIPLKGGYNRGRAIAKLFEVYCEKELIQPTFILDYPRETTPLCKPHREDPSLVERFELYIGGLELANAYTELNDPTLQHQFFMEQLERKKLGDEEVHEYDSEFIESLSYGMPPAGGIGIGIDRLTMLLTNSRSIKEVILFPMMKRANFKSPME